MKTTFNGGTFVLAQHPQDGTSAVVSASRRRQATVVTNVQSEFGQTIHGSTQSSTSKDTVISIGDSGHDQFHQPFYHQSPVDPNAPVIEFRHSLVRIEDFPDYAKKYAIFNALATLLIILLLIVCFVMVILIYTSM